MTEATLLTADQLIIWVEQHKPLADYGRPIRFHNELTVTYADSLSTFDPDGCLQFRHDGKPVAFLDVSDIKSAEPTVRGVTLTLCAGGEIYLRRSDWLPIEEQER